MHSFLLLEIELDLKVAELLSQAVNFVVMPVVRLFELQLIIHVFLLIRKNFRVQKKVFLLDLFHRHPLVFRQNLVEQRFVFLDLIILDPDSLVCLFQHVHFLGNDLNLLFVLPNFLVLIRHCLKVFLDFLVEPSAGN